MVTCGLEQLRAELLGEGGEVGGGWEEVDAGEVLGGIGEVAGELGSDAPGHESDAVCADVGASAEAVRHGCEIRVELLHDVVPELSAERVVAIEHDRGELLARARAVKR